jgi:hypothetical protein
MVAGTLVGVPNRVNRLTIAHGPAVQRPGGQVTRHDAFTKHLEASHLGIDKAAPMIGTSLLPDFLPSRRVAARMALRTVAPGR